ncbi:unnamed protein product [Tilletia controversa]|nr:unnamed protein product [Tilletia controversa]
MTSAHIHTIIVILVFIIDLDFITVLSSSFSTQLIFSAISSGALCFFEQHQVGNERTPTPCALRHRSPLWFKRRPKRLGSFSRRNVVQAKIVIADIVQTLLHPRFVRLNARKDNHIGHRTANPI